MESKVSLRSRETASHNNGKKASCLVHIHRRSPSPVSRSGSDSFLSFAVRDAFSYTEVHFHALSNKCPKLDNTFRPQIPNDRKDADRGAHNGLQARSSLMRWGRWQASWTCNKPATSCPR